MVPGRFVMDSFCDVTATWITHQTSYWAMRSHCRCACITDMYTMWTSWYITVWLVAIDRNSRVTHHGITAGTATGTTHGSLVFHFSSSYTHCLLTSWTLISLEQFIYRCFMTLTFMKQEPQLMSSTVVKLWSKNNRFFMTFIDVRPFNGRFFRWCCKFHCGSLSFNSITVQQCTISNIMWFFFTCFYFNINLFSEVLRYISVNSTLLPNWGWRHWGFCL